MPQISPDGTAHPVSLTQRMTLRPAPDWQGAVELAQPGPAVLGEAQEPATTVPLSLFEPAEPAIELNVRQAPLPAVLSDEQDRGAALEYQPAEPAVYVLLQEVHTPDGIIYDWTLPQRVNVAAGRGVLGEELDAPEKLHFPINRVVGAEATGAGPGATVLGIEDAIGDLVAGQVLQLLKSPIDRALRAGVWLPAAWWSSPIGCRNSARYG